MVIVIPTIDVEGVHGQRPFEEMVLGEVGAEQPWGVMLLARIFRSYGISATFFVDIYEHTLWGEGPIVRVCEGLLNMGQDVQLHTHPSWRDDPYDFRFLRELKRRKSFLSQEKDFMGKLSLTEQVEVLEHGIEFFKKHLGRSPIAHRSGGYSINEDTLTALRRVNIAVDSSMNISHVHSQVTWSGNRVMLQNGLLELPVTVMEYRFRIRANSTGITMYSKLMKTDLDTCTLEELHWFVEEAERIGFGFMNLFMHSYSLLRFDPLYRKIRPDPTDLAKLDRFLSKLSTQDSVLFMNCSSFLEYYQTNPSQGGTPDGIPQIDANRHIIHLAVLKARNLILDMLLR